MSKSHIKWLYRELPTLVAQGVLPASAAGRLKDYYGNPEADGSRHGAVVLFGIIGAVLVGAGIILLLAHNWDQFSRATRTLVAFLPLVLGQAAGLWILRKPEAGAGAREGVAAFIFLTLGACLAMVSQIYHLSDDFSAFLLTWMVLALPLVYVFQAVLPAVFYLVGITAWAIDMQNSGSYAIGFWPLAALLIPVGGSWVKKNPYQPRSYLLLWSAALCLCVATGVCLEKVLPGLWIIVYAGLFGLLYLSGAFWFREGASWWQRPLQTVGGLGSAILVFLLTFSWPWDEIGWHYYRSGEAFHSWAAVLDYALAIGLPVAALALLATCARRQRRDCTFLGAFPVVAILGYSMTALTLDGLLAMLLFNMYLFGLALFELIGGFKLRRTSKVNAGMLLLSALIVARFFDGHFDFVVRGLVFILLGVGFFVVNLVLLRQKKGGAS